VIDLNPLAQYGALGIMLAACLCAISWMTRRFIMFLEVRLVANEAERDQFRAIIDRQSDTLLTLNQTMREEHRRRAEEAAAIKKGLDDVCAVLQRMNVGG